VQNKNTARVTVTARVRTYAQAIANNPGVYEEIADCKLKIEDRDLQFSICSLQFSIPPPLPPP
jgi:hypothetical protein